jgi:hypothetical protein
LTCVPIRERTILRLHPLLEQHKLSRASLPGSPAVAGRAEAAAQVRNDRGREIIAARPLISHLQLERVLR